MVELYDMIFKRKSVRKFDKELTISTEELQEIEDHIEKLIPLIKDITIKMRIVKREETTSKRGEYCLLIYSERKENHLLNAGYLLEQMDLYLASLNIGVCWYGLAKTDELQFVGLDYIIMLAFGKCKESDFRKDYKKCKRKDLDIIWKGQFDSKVSDVARYAPSACNSQPWRVISENNSIKVYRNPNIKTFMPPSKRPFFNSIDMGIFLCFLEITLDYHNYDFKRVLSEEQHFTKEYIEIATYSILVK